jgi:hypothetical protein
MEPVDPELARETHLDALWATVRSSRFGKAEGVVEAAAAARVRGGEPASATDLLLEAVIARVTRGYEPARPTVARARRLSCRGIRGIPSRADLLVLARVPARDGPLGGRRGRRSGADSPLSPATAAG